jgi:hypothetical protein
MFISVVRTYRMKINLTLSIDTDEIDIRSLIYLIKNYLETIYGEETEIAVTSGSGNSCNCADDMVIDFRKSNTEIRFQAQELSKSFQRTSRSVYRLVECPDEFLTRCRKKFIKDNHV